MLKILKNTKPNSVLQEQLIKKAYLKLCLEILL